METKKIHQPAGWWILAFGDENKISLFRINQ
jgi:hypothetical protein